MPESLTTINKNAFFNCRFLKYINFPENSNLQVFEENCFYSKFKSLFVPKNVKKINYFEDLVIIEFGSNSLIKVIDKESFHSFQKTIVMIPQGNLKVPKFKFIDNNYEW